MNSLNRKIFRDYKTLKAQVFTVAVLIICGISVLVSSWSSYQSLQSAKDSFYREFRFAEIFADVVRAPSSVLSELARLEGIQTVEARIIREGLVEVSGQTEPALGRLISWAGPEQTLNQIYLRQGRMPQANTQAASFYEVLVHESFAAAHGLKPGDRLSILLDGRERSLQITGIGLSPEYVYSLSPVAPFPDDKHFGVFWMPRRDLEILTGMSGALNNLQMSLVAGGDEPEIRRQVDLILKPFGGTKSYPRARQFSHLFVEDEIRQQRVMAILVPAIFLSVGMFILHIIFARLITLHRGQIATLKALGYSDWSLTRHYFLLVTLVLLTGVGPALLAGAWIGRWYAGLYQDFFRFPSIDFTLSASSVAFGVLAALLSGWLGIGGALMKVFALQPAEALRPLSPPDFQKSLFEKLGLLQKMKPYSKMVFRSLLFRPWRLVLGMTGIAVSLAIIINGSFWVDVMDFIMDRQFNEMHREDLSVRLLTPQGADVISELKAIPGVVMAEGERSVPVTLQFQHFSKNIIIIARSEDAQLSRVLDGEGNLVVPSQGGVVLSRYFQKEFGLQSGDLVRMKVLEGAQVEFDVQVLGFVDDLLGQQAYALKSDLHRWLREQAVSDTVHLKIDPSRAEQIYVTLRERPKIAAVTIQRLLLKGFQETVADMILTFTFVLYAFAVAIAGAVIYNSARIGFSERSWEMASLRILGFDVVPTFELLFLDIGIQVLLSLLPGLLFGYWLSVLTTQAIHNETFAFPVVVNPSTYALAVLVLLLTFLLSGIFLYRKTRRLDFSEALKARE